MVKVINKRNCVYQLAYHVIWCPKYRKHIFKGFLKEQLSSILHKICEERKWEVISLEIQVDHIHLFLSIPPAVSIANAVRILKGVSARKLFLQSLDLKKQLYGGHLWSPSYYVGSAGNVSAETIRKYIERAEHMTGRRR